MIDECVYDDRVKAWRMFSCRSRREGLSDATSKEPSLRSLDADFGQAETERGEAFLFMFFFICHIIFILYSYYIHIIFILWKSE